VGWGTASTARWANMEARTHRQNTDVPHNTEIKLQTFKNADKRAPVLKKNLQNI
jgi:hypothetical protein